jgi:pimeloyl-ACP methyl ester carboxylesterase
MLHEETKINLPGFYIAVKKWHSAKSKPVLCLHGKLDNAASFDLVAPYLTNFQLLAVDCPGTGYSSHYPEGVVPHWKNDAFLFLHLINDLNLQEFDIIAHSLGHLLAAFIAIAKPNQVRKIVFLDVLGPTVNFIENATHFLVRDVDTYLNYNKQAATVFPDIESVIRDRMKIATISYQAAQALAQRGTKKSKEGWIWNFDRRLRCLSATIPHEDELQTMFKAINACVCLIRAKQGIPYPEHTFRKRVEMIKNLTIYEVEGGHHLHMDNPLMVAEIIDKFLGD